MRRLALWGESVTGISSEVGGYGLTCDDGVNHIQSILLSHDRSTVIFALLNLIPCCFFWLYHQVSIDFQWLHWSRSWRGNAIPSCFLFLHLFQLPVPELEFDAQVTECSQKVDGTKKIRILVYKEWSTRIIKKNQNTWSCCKSTRRFYDRSGTVHAQPRWGRIWGFWQTNPPWDLVHQNVCEKCYVRVFLLKTCCHVACFGNRFKTGFFVKIMPNLLDTKLKEKPQTAVFSLPFLLGFRQLQRGALWMDGRSKPFTDMAGWLRVDFPWKARWLLLGRGEVNPRCFNTFDWKELETWIKQEITAAQFFEAIDVWVFWDVEMLGLLHFSQCFTSLG